MKEFKFNDMTFKELRTLRNSLNNRLKSFSDELKFGKELPKLSASHRLFDLSEKECIELLAVVKKEISKKND